MSYQSGIIRTSNRFEVRGGGGRSLGMCRARRKVRWKTYRTGPKRVKQVGCSGCGWAKGVGHDWTCKFVERRKRS